MSFINTSYIDMLIHDLVSVILILCESRGKLLQLPQLKLKVQTNILEAELNTKLLEANSLKVSTQKLNEKP